MTDKLIQQRPLPAQLPAGLHGLSPLLQRIYAARGVEHVDQLQRGLQALAGVQQLHGLEEGVSLLTTAIEQQQHICIVGDFDCDGATSTALAILGLRELGARRVSYQVPNRFEHGYGLSPELVAQMPADIDLVVTVDNGIAAHQGVAAAQARGWRVLVTDHHLAGESLPAADAIINPNQPDCAFPSKALCGVGVMFYVLVALRQRLRERGHFTGEPPNLARFLDLVALGTVADVVPLDSNNRILVHQGLQRIRAGQARPGIQALLRVAGRVPSMLTAADLGFAIGPRLNAAGRLDDISVGIECLLTESEQLANFYADQLNEMNLARREIEQDMQYQALQELERLELNQQDLPWGLALYDPDWHQGVIGILASRIKDRTYRPVIAMARGERGEVKGSARSIPGLHIRDALAAVDARHPGLLQRFGGHAMAAGLTLDEADLAQFRQAFDVEVRNRLRPTDLQAILETDGELPPALMNLDTAWLLRQAGPWGQHFPEPLFEGEFELRQQRIVGERHLKLVVGNSQGQWEGIHFNADLRLWPSQSRRARLVYRLDINEFRGETRLQLMVEYLQAC
ncbi:single-stranded-DNA-specific exonuclease RecJ [Balneatrix alpica]|uniref:Single-stranded-DNA-specific exonuclease RecJ n=1 Tax=Balneatrix alpica TaxID=75684 RepID=A0ABV5ZCM4_9GAMM|nr:single-stranded-DNA-specific exonuclease RecJ [Balneatrix alpica]